MQYIFFHIRQTQQAFIHLNSQIFYKSLTESHIMYRMEQPFPFPFPFLFLFILKCSKKEHNYTRKFFFSLTFLHFLRNETESWCTHFKQQDITIITTTIFHKREKLSSFYKASIHWNSQNLYKSITAIAHNAHKCTA